MSSTAKRNGSPEVVVDRLFERLAAMYGRAWLDMWTGANMGKVKAEWAHSLHGFDLETMRLALESLKTEGVKFPPNLPEFVHLCRQFVRAGPHRLALAAPRYEPPENVFARLRKQLYGQDDAA
jgi:hypothetical protein